MLGLDLMSVQPLMLSVLSLVVPKVIALMNSVVLSFLLLFPWYQVSMWPLLVFTLSTSFLTRPVMLTFLLLGSWSLGVTQQLLASFLSVTFSSLASVVHAS